ncbi:MAG: hypothetical protein QHC65_04145 [Sphingomonas sp.]|nr:hypothetical protein [Sphingomonas sp.]MDX3883589.1 hypothetical protein [Sphingomonas sp.]
MTLIAILLAAVAACLALTQARLRRVERALERLRPTDAMPPYEFSGECPSIRGIRQARLGILAAPGRRRPS